MIIRKRVYVKAADGEPISYRTKYYRYYDGKHASVGSKQDAVHMDSALAAQVCAQLNQIAGEGWEVADPKDRPARAKVAA